MFSQNCTQVKLSVISCLMHSSSSPVPRVREQAPEPNLASYLFVQMNFYWNQPCLLIYTVTVVAFTAMLAELSSCDRDRTDCNIYNIFNLTLCRKSWPSPARAIVTFSCGCPSCQRDCAFSGFGHSVTHRRGMLGFPRILSVFSPDTLSLPPCQFPRHRNRNTPPSQTYRALSLSSFAFPTRLGSLYTCYSCNSAQLQAHSSHSKIPTRGVSIYLKNKYM